MAGLAHWIRPALAPRTRPLGVDDPDPEIRLGMAMAGLFFVGFLGWAAFAHLDAAAIAPGSVTASGGPQAVQSRDGGVIQALYVVDGQHVEKGQVLLEIAADDLRVRAEALTARVFAQKAEIQRLTAERMGQGLVQPWPGMDKLIGPEADQAKAALAVEQAVLETRLRADRTQRAVLAQRITQSREQINGVQSEIEALRTQDKVIDREIGGFRTLAAQGYAPRVRVDELERTAAGLKGSLGSRQADAARLSSSIGETQLQIADHQLQRAQQVEEALRDADAELRNLEPQLADARGALRRAQIRAPVDGTVFAAKANTVGGVALPGEKLMMVVPSELGLVIEAQVAAKDAADLHAGAQAEVRFPAFHQRDLPIVEGVIRDISADSYRDDRTGIQYYLAHVHVPDAQVAALKRARGGGQALKPGLPAEVVVTLRRRSALQYMFEPLLQAFSHSFNQR